jgi:hypothetical protein
MMQMRRTVCCRSRVPRGRLLSCVFLAAAAATLGCLPGASEPRPRGFSAQELDRIDAEVERRAAGRWPSWTMNLEAGVLAFRVELGSEATHESPCHEIEDVMKRKVGGRVPWSLEILRRGRVVERCSQDTAASPHAASARRA